mmetsp:Transcript_6436/g.17373  ORF Transcript_6436/g.17373 Transcript_6436/m.17373 type:complete len:202 (+) Transcript_6436:197-802(+)
MVLQLLLQLIARHLPPGEPTAFDPGAYPFMAKPGSRRILAKLAQQHADRSLCFTVTGFFLLDVGFLDDIGLWNVPAPAEVAAPCPAAAAPGAAVAAGGPIMPGVWTAVFVGRPEAVWGYCDAWGYCTSMEGAVGMEAAPWLVTIDGAICSDGRGLACTAWGIGIGTACMVERAGAIAATGCGMKLADCVCMGAKVVVAGGM